MLDPLAVILKFALLAVLYLFLVWMAASARRDLRRLKPGVPSGASDETGMHSVADSGRSPSPALAFPRLRIDNAAGLPRGRELDLTDRPLVIGRSAHAAIQLNDPFASGEHAQIELRGGITVLEDLGSTNGTYLNGELVRGAQVLHGGDRVTIGDNEFTYLQ